MVAQKKSVAPKKQLPKGTNVILEKLPPGLIDGLPEEDQRAISAIVGVPIRLSGYDDDGRLELEFVEANGTGHFIYVDRKYVKAARGNSRKVIKRRE